MDNDALLALIEQKSPGLISSAEPGYDGILNLATAREQLIGLLQLLRDEPELNYHFLTTLCTVHYPEATGHELELVYFLHNWPHNRRLRVKTTCSVADPHVPTATTLWPAANWMERQEYDFFGVIFDGHPDLRRILNVDEMEVFPMRKEYRLEDATRTDKDDRYFGRDGNYGQKFD